jgi:tetratricopeptide (TPR) repeat protein
MTDRKSNSRIFISYSSEDRRWADLLTKELIRHGLNVFYDQTSLIPGEDWTVAIKDALLHSDTVLVLVSSSARKSAWMEAELELILSAASTGERTVIPVLLPESSFGNIPPGLQDRAGIDLREDILNNPNLEKFILQQDAENLVALNNLSAIYLEKDDFEQARGYFEKALQLDPQNASIHNNLGSYYRRRGAYSEALEHYQQAIVSQPDNAGIYNNLATVFSSTKEYEKAIQCYDMALRLQPDNVEVINNLASTYKSMADYSRAIDLYNRAMQLQPGNPILYNNLGSTYQAMGESHKAVDMFEKALVLYPDSVVTLNNLAGIYYDLDDLDRALDIYQGLIPRIKGGTRADDFSLSLIHNNIGSILSRKGQYRKALDHSLVSVKLTQELFGERHPNTAVLYNNIGLIYTALGDLPKAIDCFEKAVQIMKTTFDEKDKSFLLVKSNLEKAILSRGQPGV